MPILGPKQFSLLSLKLIYPLPPLPTPYAAEGTPERGATGGSGWGGKVLTKLGEGPQFQEGMQDHCLFNKDDSFVPGQRGPGVSLQVPLP